MIEQQNTVKVKY